ncbi:MAG TPA: aminoglycoside phosphotransferase family protein [Candidatus Faecalibacterium gallistercoris]|uniref:Aminoglycoside phosphotransferase family protein n=1 Tax=Candidatus Faecalibacterium gallistercoris TaxID=2838579 RepID=A0A9D2FGD6_9FIRM|nr:aminoglycoside phosphotransferase family protein [Candidatus Faecalibacterium gallistercoris]
MKPVTQELLRQAAAAFDFGLPTGEAQRYGAGHINDTFAVWAADHSRRWILQRINTDTFTDPAGLMENVTGVTSYLRREILARGGDPDRETLNVVPTREGKPYYTDCEGGAWRAYLFVEGTVCLQKVENERDFYTAAETFGNFQNQLAGYPAATLHETIARFHDTPNRYANFEKALAADVMGRAREIGPEIAFIRAREADCHVLMDQLAAGVLPLRVTHNDTKLNNVLIDQATGKGICVIDLDTVMPGLSAYDFGDSIRFGANDCAEDEPDQSKVHFSLHLYEVFARGYLAAAGSAMTEAERRSLPWGAKLMTLECGIRFLTDYLEGDHYFKISRPAQNLDRARTQFTLVEGMEREFDAMTQLALEL